MEKRYFKYQNYLSYPIGLFLAIIVFSITLFLLGYDPISALVSIPIGAFGNLNSFSETFIRLIPLLLTAMAFLIALKARFLNLGIEGQLYIGALLAYLVGANMGIVPSFIAIPLIIIVGFIGGVLWLAIPLIIKTKLGVNEIFSTVVMNFIAIIIISWLTVGPLKDPGSLLPRTHFLPESTWMPKIDPQYRLHVGIFLVVIIALILYMILNKTTIGYKIRAVGQNPRASEHGGVDVTRVVITAGLLSGGIAGLSGFMEVFGVHHYLFGGISPGFGYIGIAVAALGMFHPIGVIFTAFFFAVLQIGGTYMQQSAGISIDIIFIMQAVLVLTVLIVQKWMTMRNSS
ncbi:MAG: ABC transporter permease [Promethearchaeota archaeon]